MSYLLASLHEDGADFVDEVDLLDDRSSKIFTDYRHRPEPQKGLD